MRKPPTPISQNVEALPSSGVVGATRIGPSVDRTIAVNLLRVAQSFFRRKEEDKGGLASSAPDL